jgi:hypothetical protein
MSEHDRRAFMKGAAASAAALTLADLVAPRATPGATPSARRPAASFCRARRPASRPGPPDRPPGRGRRRRRRSARPVTSTPRGGRRCRPAARRRRAAPGSAMSRDLPVPASPTRLTTCGVEPLGERGEPGEIGEEDGDLPAVGVTGGAVRLRGGLGQRRTGGDRAAGAWASRRAAPGTERKVGLARETARGTGPRQRAPAARAEGEARGSLGAAAGAGRKIELTGRPGPCARSFPGEMLSLKWSMAR